MCVCGYWVCLLVSFASPQKCPNEEHLLWGTEIDLGKLHKPFSFPIGRIGSVPLEMSPQMLCHYARQSCLKALLRGGRGGAGLLTVITSSPLSCPCHPHPSVIPVTEPRTWDSVEQIALVVAPGASCWPLGLAARPSLFHRQRVPISCSVFQKFVQLPCL